MAAKSSSGSQVINAQTSNTGSTYASPTSGCQSSAQDVRTYLGSLWTGRVTNGPTGPTIAASWQIDTSFDGTAWRNFATGQTLIGNNVVTDIGPVELPLPVMYTRITFFGNTAQNVTVSAELQNATGIA